jgi:hypothetical protein
MRRRAGRALGAAAGLAALILAGALAARSAVPAHVAVLPWPGGDADPGGWSGIEVSDDGASFWAVSDRGHFAEGSLVRDAAGRLRAASIARTGPLAREDGAPIPEPWQDAESLARTPDGSFLIAFEWYHRVWRHAALGSAPTRGVPGPVPVADKGNIGIEALAVDASGAVWGLSELPVPRGPDTALYRLRPEGLWDERGRIDRDGNWSVVGADFAPDGGLYLLERQLVGPGFVSRIRRFDLGAGERPAGRTVYRAPLGRHGNLEGLAIWTGPDGAPRAVMVTDDNRMPFQRGGIVEVILPLAAPGGGA